MTPYNSTATVQPRNTHGWHIVTYYIREAGQEYIKEFRFDTKAAAQQFARECRANAKRLGYTN